MDPELVCLCLCVCVRLCVFVCPCFNGDNSYLTVLCDGFVFLFEILWATLRALCMLGKCFTTELYPNPHRILINEKDRCKFWKVVSM